MKQAWLGWVLLGCMAATGCKEPRPAVPEVQPLTLRLEPPSATLTAGRSLKFTAIASGGAGESLFWKVLEPGGGTVDSSGRYEAPLLPGEYSVQVGPRGGAGAVRAKVQVVGAPDGAIQAPPRLRRGSTDNWASVPAVEGSRYAWTVKEGKLLEGGASPAIRFEPGAGPKTLLVCRVTNAAGDTLNSSLEVPVAAAVALRITPERALLTAGRRMKFGFEITGGGSLEVAWSLVPAGGGTLDDSGWYQAPAGPCVQQVRVAAKDDPGKWAEATVKVVAEPAGAIQAISPVRAGAKGLVASLPSQVGMSYAWSISGGEIVSGGDGEELTFNAGTGARVTLRCRIQNEAGDSLDMTKELVTAP